MISINVITVNRRDDRQSYGSEDSMTGVIPTATPVPLFVQDSPNPEDLARALTERGFYVFGWLNTQKTGKGGEGPSSQPRKTIQMAGKQDRHRPST